METNKEVESNFIRTIVTEDLKQGKMTEIVTRFPPEPNGYLHIGHARAICINFDTAASFGGRTHLRFDDTNPTKEDVEYVEAIKRDIRWLGFEWDALFFASDYFEEMYNRAVILIKKGLAYVDDQTPDEIRQTRGTLTEPGQESPYRNRGVEENLDLFTRMRAGEFKDGERVLRAKVDMKSPNINMRDPVIYRILHATHHNTGDQWCIYPMYTYAHPLEDAIEYVTHSLCSLEFEDQRPFYDWVVKHTDISGQPRQYEFGKLNIENAIIGKRHIRKLVDDGIIEGWDDPRVHTISGMRRRGYTPEAIKAFVRAAGVSKSNGTVDPRMLEHFVREDLKLKAPRTMGVLRPLKVVITNYPEGQVEWLDAEINPENPEMGMRKIPFSREIYIEQDDFMEEPPPKYFRLFPGNEVRLKHAYFIKCEEFIKDEQGNVIELRCTYDPETKSGSGFTGRKVKGTLHWVEATHAIPAEFRLYDNLLLPKEEVSGASAEVGSDTSAQSVDTQVLEAGLNDEMDVNGADGGTDVSEDAFSERLNPNSLEILQGFIEPNMKDLEPQTKYQFFRHGYFNVDPVHTKKDKLVFNLIVSLKSSYRF